MTTPPPIVTEEDIKHWHDSGEEIFRYAKDIMGLDPAYTMCSLSTAMAKTLLLSIPLDSNDVLIKHLDIVKSTILYEMLRIGAELSKAK